MKRFALFVSLCVASLASAHPVDDLLRHVPKDAALCLVVRDADNTLKQLADSPFVAWLPKSAFGNQLTKLRIYDPEAFGEFNLTLTAHFGLTFADLQRDVFGDAFVFAFMPGPPERALILIKPRKPEVAAKFLKKLDELQKDELTAVMTVTMNGVPVTIREKKDGTAEAYSLHEGILAFAGEAESLKLYHAWRAEGGQPAPVAATLARLKSQSSTVNLWIDPRSFDREFQAKAKANPNDKLVNDLITGVWQSIDDLAIHADVTDVLTVRASMRFKKEKVPAAATNVLPPQVGRSALWDVIPADALIAVAGRMAFGETVKKIDGPGNMTKSLGPIVGKDKLSTVLEAIGPDWGLWLTAPEKTEQWLPEWTFALKVRPDPTGKLDMEKTLFESVDSGAQLLRLMYNSANTDQLELREEIVKGTKYRIIANEKLPPGTMPCFAVKEGYFIFTSHPDRITRFQPPKEGANDSTESPLIRISASGLRSYLLRHTDSLTKAFQTLPSDKQKLTDLSELLEAFERFELTASHADGISRLTLTCVPVKPLKK